MSHVALEKTIFIKIGCVVKDEVSLKAVEVYCKISYFRRTEN